MPKQAAAGLYMQSAALSKLEAALGHVFQDRLLLVSALTHRSFMHEQPQLKGIHNQRLEFLGDAILGLSIATEAYHLTANLTEGQMSKLRAAVVCEESLSDCAKTIELAQYLQLGRGERGDNGPEKPSILADAMEALFAAIYLDANFEVAQRCILTLMRPYIEAAVAGKLAHDYKTKLQEYAQSLPGQVPLEFQIIDSSGPVHKRIFLAQVRLQEQVAEGSGYSKKQAEQEAARALLNML